MNAPVARDHRSGAVHPRAQRMTREQRREQLLGTALTVFSQGGYHATSMDDIASAAGVSKPVLYQHFPGKRDLFLALVNHTLRSLSQRLAASLERTETNRDRVRNVIETHFDFVCSQPEAHRLVFTADLMSFPEVAEQLDAFHQSVSDEVAGFLGPGTGVNRSQAALLSRGLVHMVQTSAVYWTHHPEAGSRDEVQNRVFHLAWGGIKTLNNERPAAAPRLGENESV